MNKIIGSEIETLNKDTSLPPVKYITFTEENESELVEEEIAKLLSSGVKKQDITLLSPFVP